MKFTGILHEKLDRMIWSFTSIILQDDRLRNVKAIIPVYDGVCAEQKEHADF